MGGIDSTMSNEIDRGYHPALSASYVVRGQGLGTLQPAQNVVSNSKCMCSVKNEQKAGIQGYA